MHVGKPGAPGIAFIDTQLMDIIAVAGDQGTKAGQSPRPVEHIALRLGAHRDDPLPAALGPSYL